MDIIGPSASGSMLVLIETLEKAFKDSTLINNYSLPHGSALLQQWGDKLNYEGDPILINLALGIWAKLHGLVSLELNGQFCSTENSNEITAFYSLEIRSLINNLGLGEN